MAKHPVLKKKPNGSDFDWVLELIGIQNIYRVYAGEGHFSRVLETNRGTVLKLTVDNTYTEYLEAVKDSDNPFFPKMVKNYGCIAEIGDGVELYAVEMERCVDVGYHTIKKYSNLDYETFCSLTSGLKSGMNSKKGDVSALIMGRGNVGYDQITTLCETMNLDYFKFLDAIHFIAKKFSYEDVNYDMHASNFMFNREGQLIINDPVAGRKTIESGICVGFGKGKLGQLKYDRNKIKEVSQLFGGNFTSLFAAFKIQNSYCESKNKDFRDSEESGDTSRIEVKLGDKVLHSSNTYQKEKSKKEKKCVLKFNEGSKVKRVTLEGFWVD